MRDWAERGISVYGQQASRPEAVEDLHERLDYGTAKIDLARRRPSGSRRRPSAGRVADTRSGESGAVGT